MKKLLSFALFFAVFSVKNLQAQQDFTELFDSVFVNISRSGATTGILYDRVIPFSNLKQFSGNNPDTADMYQFLYGYTLSFIATYNNGISDTCYAKIHVSSISRATCTPPPFQTSGKKYPITTHEFHGYSFKDYDDVTKSNAGNVWVYYAHSDKKMRKPILIVDGFDPGNIIPT